VTTCSFCLRKGVPLVRGPSAAICDNCVRLASWILGQNPTSGGREHEEEEFRAAHMASSPWPTIAASFDAAAIAILDFRYGFADGVPHSLDEVAKQFGVSRQELRRLDDELKALIGQPDN